MEKNDIAHLANLARIELTAAEEIELTEDITEILGYVSAVGDIAATEKAKNVSGLYNVLREDAPSHEPGAYTERILKSAPSVSGRFVEVKKILGDSQ